MNCVKLSSLAGVERGIGNPTMYFGTADGDPECDVDTDLDPEDAEIDSASSEVSARVKWDVLSRSRPRRSWPRLMIRYTTDFCVLR